MTLSPHVARHVRRLVNRGSALTHGDMTAIVGWHRLRPGRLYWFEAGGSSEFHGHVLTFDRAEIVHDLGASFYRDGQMVGYLTPLEETEEPALIAQRPHWPAWLEHRRSLLRWLRAQASERIGEDLRPG